MTLVDKFIEITEGHSTDDDFRLISEVLREVDFLYSRGLLEEKKLGRFVDIINSGGKLERT